MRAAIPKTTTDNASDRVGRSMARAMSLLLLLMFAWAGNSWAITTTHTTLDTSSNPSALNQAVTLTAKVYGASVTGTVNFYDGATWLGASTPSGGHTSATATLSYSFTVLGTHNLTAVYSGDANNTGSTSPVISQVVVTYLTTTTLYSVCPCTTVQPYPFIIIVSNGVTAPTGTVTFLDSFNGVTISTSFQLSPDGSVGFLYTFTSVGTHSLTAVYSGDANNLPSISTTQSAQVN